MPHERDSGAAPALQAAMNSTPNAASTAGTAQAKLSPSRKLSDSRRARCTASGIVDA